MIRTRLERWIVLITFMTGNEIKPVAANSNMTADTAGNKITAQEISLTQLDEIEVSAIKLDTVDGNETSGYRVMNSEIGTLGSMNKREAPFTVHTSSAEEYENRGAHTLLDAVKNNPVVIPTLAPNTDQRGLSNVSIRGFSPNYLLDGLPVNSYHMPSVENVERIEVINGLTSFFYGFGSYGGAVNFITKRPSKELDANISAGQYNGNVRFVKGGLTGPFDSKKMVTYRVDGAAEEGETFIDQQRQKNILISGVVKFEPFSGTEIGIDLYNQDYEIKGQQNIFSVNPSKKIFVPDADKLDPEVLYGQPWTFASSRFTQSCITVKSKINEMFTIRGAYRYGDAWWKYNYITASFTDNNLNFSSVDNDFGYNQRYYNAGYGMTDIKLKTGPFKHTITTGYLGNNTLIHFGGNPIVSVNLGKANVAAPKYVAVPDTLLMFPDTLVNYNRYYYHSILAGDKIELTDKLTLLAGGCEAIYSTKRTSGNMSQSIAADYTQKKFNPSIALMYKPLEELSTYGSYNQGLGTGGVTTTAWAKNKNEILAPSVNNQLEIGVKSFIAGIDISVSGFCLDKKNEFLDLRDSVYKQDGRQVHLGIEGTVQGKLANIITVGGGATVMSAKITSAQVDSLENKVPVDVPLQQGRLFIEYTFPGFLSGLSVSSGVNYCGKRFVDISNLDYTPSVTTFDAGARYLHRLPGERAVALIVNVTNLTDKTYWASYQSNGLRLGAPRLISATARFNI